MHIDRLREWPSWIFAQHPHVHHAVAQADPLTVCGLGRRVTVDARGTDRSLLLTDRSVMRRRVAGKKPGEKLR